MKPIKRLRDLRESNKLSFKEVGAIMRITSQHYQKYENGLAPIPVERLEKLADFYGTSVDYLLERTSVKTPYPKK